MNAHDILTAAHRAGIRLSLADNGKLKFAGRQAALDRLLPEIRADGAVLSVSRCPPCPLADVQADYPEGVCEVERVPETAVALAPADLALAQAVLKAWGEDDPVMIEEWMDGLAREPARLQQMRAQAVALGLVSRDG